MRSQRRREHEMVARRRGLADAERNRYRQPRVVFERHDASLHSECRSARGAPLERTDVAGYRQWASTCGAGKGSRPGSIRAAVRLTAGKTSGGEIRPGRCEHRRWAVGVLEIEARWVNLRRVGPGGVEKVQRLRAPCRVTDRDQIADGSGTFIDSVASLVAGCGVSVCGPLPVSAGAAASHRSEGQCGGSVASPTRARSWPSRSR